MNLSKPLIGLLVGNQELPATYEETRKRYGLCKKELVQCFIIFLITTFISYVLVMNPVTLGPFDILPQAMCFAMYIFGVVVRAFLIFFIGFGGFAGLVLQIARVCFFYRRLQILDERS